MNKKRKPLTDGIALIIRPFAPEPDEVLVEAYLKVPEGEWLAIGDVAALAKSPQEGVLRVLSSPRVIKQLADNRLKAITQQKGRVTMSKATGVVIKEEG